MVSDSTRSNTTALRHLSKAIARRGSEPLTIPLSLSIYKTSKTVVTISIQNFLSAAAETFSAQVDEIIASLTETANRVATIQEIVQQPTGRNASASPRRVNAAGKMGTSTDSDCGLKFSFH